MPTAPDFRKPAAARRDSCAPLSRLPESLQEFDSLPNSALVRVPTVAKLFGVSTVTVWRHVAGGKLPAPVRFSERVTAWRVGDLREVLAEKAAA